MQATARRLSVVSATSHARRRLIRDVRPLMSSQPQTLRFSRNRVGAAYPLRADEVLQLRAPLRTAAGVTGRFILRVTQNGERERAEYWIGSPHDFVSVSDELPDDLLQRVSRALSELALAAEGYRPDVDANDSGRSIIFWRHDQPMTVFIPNHPTACQPPEDCLLAFDRLWSIVTESV